MVDKRASSALTLISREHALYSQRYSKTPWAILTNDICDKDELTAAGFVAHCGVQHDHNGFFRSCDGGNCENGECKGHADL